VFTTFYGGVLVALNRATGQVVYRHRLPSATNAPIAIAGDTMIVPAGARSKTGGGGPQVVAYTVR
jgi:outer membrane protein assembly factor BamB